MWSAHDGARVSGDDRARETIKLRRKAGTTGSGARRRSAAGHDGHDWKRKYKPAVAPDARRLSRRYIYFIFVSQIKWTWAPARVCIKKKTRRRKDIYTRLNRGRIDDWGGGGYPTGTRTILWFYKIFLLQLISKITKFRHFDKCQFLFCQQNLFNLLDFLRRRKIYDFVWIDNFKMRFVI